MPNWLEQAPQPRRDAVRDALAVAFGDRKVAGFRLLKGGVSGAMIWQVAVNGRPFVLRLDPARIAPRHRRRHYACMGAAAAAAVAPPLRFADAATGVAIMDFIESRPLSEHPDGQVGLVRELGALVARLQALPPFPRLGDSDDLIAELLDALGASDLFAPGLLDPHRHGLARIRTAWPCDPSSMAPSHNDLNPRNVLFDGRRAWLIDWELASRNDPLFDIAILLTELADTPALEASLLASALCRPVDAVTRARLVLARLLTRLFYGCIALEAFANGPRPSRPEPNLDALTPAEFQSAVGRMASGSDIAWAFGKMSLRAFIDGLAAPAFEAALEICVRPEREGGNT